MSENTKPNELLDELEGSEYYQKIQNDTEDSLKSQWEDVVSSDELGTLFVVYEQMMSDNEVLGLTELTEEQTEKLEKNAEKMLALVLLGLTSSFQDSFGKYLKFVSNKAGQSVIDGIAGALGEEALKFRLGNDYFKNQLKDRVETLMVSLNETTKKNLMKQLMYGFKKGLSKEEMVARLKEKGVGIAENRAATIARTETTAFNEYIRLQTARLNGCRTKTWWNPMDEKTTKVCRSLTGTTVLVDEPFSGGFMSPPAHGNCRSHLEFDYAQSACSLQVEKSILDNKYKEWKVQKKEAEPYYDMKQTGDICYSCINRNAVWAGGESLVGKDKNIRDFTTPLIAMGVEKVTDSDIKDVFSDKENVSDVVVALRTAKDNLTDEGFVQLVSYFGYSKTINFT